MSVMRLLVISVLVCAATCRTLSWAGRTTIWEDAKNWNPSFTPTKDDDVVIWLNKTETIFVSALRSYAKTITFKDGPPVEIAVFASLSVQAVKGGINSSITVFGAAGSEFGTVEIGTFDVAPLGRANVTSLQVLGDLFVSDSELQIGASSSVNGVFFLSNANVTANAPIKSLRVQELDIFESFSTAFTAASRAQFRQALRSRSPQIFREMFPLNLESNTNALIVTKSSNLVRINLILHKITLLELGGIAENNEASITFAKGSSVTTI